ncbi:MAG: hypothetical protein HYT77_01880 [Deltaproteobacteria bacterium]|nr:hypothetical protein [Deltaproteobacteria bacterium]
MNVEASAYSSIVESVQRFLASIPQEADEMATVESSVGAIREAAAREREALEALGRTLSVPAGVSGHDVGEAIWQYRRAMSMVVVLAESNPKMNASFLRNQPSCRLLLRILGQDPACSLKPPAADQLADGLSFLIRLAKDPRAVGLLTIVAGVAVYSAVSPKSA